MSIIGALLEKYMESQSDVCTMKTTPNNSYFFEERPEPLHGVEFLMKEYDTILNHTLPIIRCYVLFSIYRLMPVVEKIIYTIFNKPPSSTFFFCPKWNRKKKN
jgi:hypothetical protein